MTTPDVGSIESRIADKLGVRERQVKVWSGMVLEGVVTNVAAFGAFVDVGVHQDGLVHVSAMSRTFVKDPRDVVKPGDIVKVKVMDVDIPRKRISLTLRLDDEAAPQGEPKKERGGRPPRQRQQRSASGGGEGAAVVGARAFQRGDGGRVAPGRVGLAVGVVAGAGGHAARRCGVPPPLSAPLEREVPPPPARAAPAARLPAAMRSPPLPCRSLPPGGGSLSPR
ncbi:Polyribonucleotide nucleotidyltransferase [Streptomyces violaceorubidus]